MFLFKNPSSSASPSLEDPEDAPLSWENAQKEKSDQEDTAGKEAKDEQLRKQEEETRERMAEFERKMEEERRLQEEQKKQMELEYQQKMAELDKKHDEAEAKRVEQQMQEEMVKMQKADEERQRKTEEEEGKIRRKQQEQGDLERRLGVILPLVNEANLISKELKRDIKFNTKLVKSLPESKGDGSVEIPTTDIQVKVDNFEEGYYYQWPEGKFNDRIFMMRDLVQEFFDTGDLPKVPKDQDPFWDPPEP